MWWARLSTPNVVGVVSLLVAMVSVKVAMDATRDNSATNDLVAHETKVKLWAQIVADHVRLKTAMQSQRFRQLSKLTASDLRCRTVGSREGFTPDAQRACHLDALAEIMP